MRVLEYDGVKLGVLIQAADRRKGLTFYSEESDFLQAGIWVYDKHKKLAAHIHNEVRREIDRTQEVIYVEQGKVKVFIYSEDEKLVEELILEKGDIAIFLRGGHGYEILEDNTHVLEIKNGPYVGAEKDRRSLKNA